MKKYLIYLSVILLLSLLLYLQIILIINTRKGFDITDESYYILRAAHPGMYNEGYSNFGVITGFIYRICNSNIVLFRLSGIILLLGVSIFSTIQFIDFQEKKLIARGIPALKKRYTFLYCRWGMPHITSGTGFKRHPITGCF